MCIYAHPLKYEKLIYIDTHMYSTMIVGNIVDLCVRVVMDYYLNSTSELSIAILML